MDTSSSHTKKPSKLQMLPTGCEALDRLLGGGFESGIITQLYGESGSGKTNVVLSTMIQAVIRGLRVIFIDTEGFSTERFRQIAGESAKDIASKIIVFEPLTLEQQQTAIHDASKLITGNVGLIVLDSATSLYRVALEGDDNRQIRHVLTSQLAKLQEIARRHRIPVVITNQVYMDVETGEHRPIGGTSVGHICKAILSFERTGTGRRRARIVKHRSQAEGTAVEFYITATGLD